MMKINLWILVFCFLPCVSRAEVQTILCLGDSLTAGYGLSSRDLAYPALMEKQFKSEGLDVRVINGGISGSTSAGGERRVRWHFRRKIDVLVLALGANDGLRGLKVSQTQKNLQIIIDNARGKNPNLKIVLAGMLVPPNMGKEYSREFAGLFPHLAKINKCTLIPFLLAGIAGEKNLNQADGIHPTEKGQAMMAELVGKYVKPLLQK